MTFSKMKPLLPVLILSLFTVPPCASAAAGTAASPTANDSEFLLVTDEAPLTDEEPSSGHYSDFVELAEYRNLPITADRSTQIENGMTVNIDFSGTIDGEIFEGSTAENYDLMVGGGAFPAEFEDALIGRRAGESLTVSVTYPWDYFDSSLAGQSAVYRIKINSVYRIAPYIALSQVIDSSTVLRYPQSLYDDWSAVYNSIYSSYDAIDGPSAAIPEDLGMDEAAYSSMVFSSMKNDLCMRALLDAEGITAEDNRFLRIEHILLANYGFKDRDAMKDAGYADVEINYAVMNELCCELLEEYSV